MPRSQGFVVHVPSGQTRARRTAVAVSGAAAAFAVLAVVAAGTGAGRSVRASLQAMSYGQWAAPGGLVGPYGQAPGYGQAPSGYGYGYGYGTTYAAAPATAYAAANYGVAQGVGGPLGGGPTLPLASVVARNAERVAANSDALLRLYQHANAGLFATNQMLLHLQNEVQAAEGTWSTVPMEFPAAYHAVPGVVAGGVSGDASVPYGPLATGAVAATTTTSTVTKTLKDAISAKFAAQGAISAEMSTASSPVAATAAVNKAVASASAAPPGFHLAWVPNAAANAAFAPPTQVVSGPVSNTFSNAWNWRPLAQASMIGAVTAPAKSIYTSESSYPYISGPYQTGSTNLFRPL